MSWLAVFSGMAANRLHNWHEIFWWTHILLIFVFANMLPYSKHFHVFISVPNVFLSRLDPLGKLPNMDSITREVKLMMDPETAFAAPAEEAPVERFGVKDVEDVRGRTILILYHVLNVEGVRRYVRQILQENDYPHGK